MILTTSEVQAAYYYWITEAGFKVGIEFRGASSILSAGNAETPSTFHQVLVWTRSNLLRIANQRLRLKFAEGRWTYQDAKV